MIQEMCLCVIGTRSKPSQNLLTNETSNILVSFKIKLQISAKN